MVSVLYLYSPGNWLGEQVAVNNWKIYNSFFVDPEVINSFLLTLK